MLVAITPFVLANDTQTWEKTDYGNLLFFDLEMKRLEFTVYNAELFFEVLINDGKPYSVMFLRDLEIIEIEWGAQTNSEDLK